MIKLKVTYTTVNQYGKGEIVERTTEWVQKGMTFRMEDLEHDHFINYIMSDAENEESNEWNYGSVKSLVSIEILNGNWHPDDVTKFPDFPEVV